MKARELKELLERFPDDLEVKASWEGCYTPLDAKDATIELDKRTNERCLVFDVEGYDVKEKGHEFIEFAAPEITRRW